MITVRMGPLPRISRLLGTSRPALRKRRYYQQGRALMLKSRASVLAAVLLVMFGYSPSLRAAVNMFLDITGIPGESTDPIHTNQVDVLAWSWGMYNSGTTGSAVAGKSTFQYLNLTKYVDKASPLLMLHCANGGPI